MDVPSVMTRLESSLGAKRVFSEPIEKDGAVIVLAAKVGGGGGGGEGTAQATDKPGQSGTGMGFGLAAKPAGAFVIRHGRVRWRPAIDVNRVILGGQLVAISAMFTLRAYFRARAAGAFRRRWRFAR